jgi:O-antigen ligase
MTGLATPVLEAPEEPSRPADTYSKGSWWFAICAMTLILASDYKLRVRDPSETVRANIDLLILVELALWGLVGVFLFVAHARRPRIGRTQAHLYLACFFVGLMVMSVAYSAFPQYALVRAGQMLVLLGLTLVAARTATRADIHRFAHLFIAVVVASVVYGVFVPSPPVTDQQGGRFTWLAIHPTVSGVLAGIATLLLVGYLASIKQPRPGPVWRPAVYWAALFVVGGGLVATQTRGAVVGSLIGITVILLALRGGRAVIELQLFLIVIVVGIALAAGGQVVTYFERGETEASISSLESRTDLWETAAQTIERKPMFGYGVTSSRGIFYDTLGLGGGHNAIVNVLVELGVVGLVTWILLVLSIVLGARRLPVRAVHDLRVDRALMLGIITFLMVDGIFYEGPGSVTNVASTWFFVTIAWLAVARRSTMDEAPGSLGEFGRDRLLQSTSSAEKGQG